MNGTGRLLFTLIGAPLAVLAFCAVLGVGILREAAPVLAALVAGGAVLLPTLGIGALFSDRSAGALLALPFTAFGLLLLFPAYFPGERGPALAAGMGTLLAGAGVEPEPAWAARADALFPGLPDGRGVVEPATPPAATAEAGAVAAAQAAPQDSPPPTTVEGDAVALPYEGSGRSLRIPVALAGRDGRELERTMIFDTGATFTTLNRATLDALGVEVSADAPELTFQTAGGDRQSRLVLLDRIWIGGLPVDGVTVGVCEPCATGEGVGLLGLNVSRHFLVTVDQARQELILEPRGGEAGVGRDATPDVQPWVELEATATRFADGRVEVTIDLFNDAPRDLSAATVAVACGEGWSVEMGPVPAGGSASRTAALGLGADCADGYTVQLSRASW